MLEYPVAYLEVSDFDQNGNLTNPKIKNKKVIVMAQADFCGYCTKAKPAYQDFAKKISNRGDIVIATIQGDSKNEGEKFGGLLQKIVPNFQGYPSYFAIVGGSKIPHEGGRALADLEQFANSL